MILVYLPPHRNLLSVIRNLRARLLTIGTGRLLGLTLAHEVGHVLRVPHASSGLMSIRPGLSEIQALSELRLTFTSGERALIERTLRRRLEMTTRSGLQ
jgi:hypothetical protein